MDGRPVRIVHLTSRLLGHPGPVRIPGHPHHMNVPRLNVDEEQHVVFDQPGPGPDFGSEEITGPARMEVSLDELVPRAFAALRSRLDAVFVENACDSQPRTLAYPELPQFPENSLGSLSGVRGHLDHQLGDLLRGPWASGLATTCAGSESHAAAVT